MIRNKTFNILKHFLEKFKKSVGKYLILIKILKNFPGKNNLINYLLLKYRFKSLRLRISFITYKNKIIENSLLSLIKKFKIKATLRSYIRKFVNMKLNKLKAIMTNLYKIETLKDYFSSKHTFKNFKCFTLLKSEINKNKKGFLINLIKIRNRLVNNNENIYVKKVFDNLRSRCKILFLKQKLFRNVLNKEFNMINSRLLRKCLFKFKIKQKAMIMTKKFKNYTNFQFLIAFEKIYRPINFIFKTIVESKSSTFKNTQKIYKSMFNKGKNTIILEEKTNNLINNPLHMKIIKYFRKLDKFFEEKLKIYLEKWFKLNLRLTITKASLKIQKFLKNKFFNKKEELSSKSCLLKLVSRKHEITINFKMSSMMKKLLNRIFILKLSNASSKIQSLYKNFKLNNRRKSLRKIFKKKLQENNKNFETLKDHFHMWKKMTIFYIMGKNKSFKKPIYKWFSYEEVLSQIYKIHFYRILNKVFLRLSSKKLIIIKIGFYSIKRKYSQYYFSKKSVSKSKSVIFSSHFKSVKDAIIQNKFREILIKIPLFVNYLRSLYNIRRSSNIHDIILSIKMKIYLKGLHKLSRYKKSFDKSFIHPIFKKFIYKVNFHLIKLKSLFSRKVHIHILYIAKANMRFDKLIIFIKTVLYHKEFSDMSFKAILINRWRFYLQIKRISKQKLKILQENMNNVYLNMADEFMGETANSMKNNVFENMVNFETPQKIIKNFNNKSSKSTQKIIKISRQIEYVDKEVEQGVEIRKIEEVEFKEIIEDEKIDY